MDEFKNNPEKFFETYFDIGVGRGKARHLVAKLSKDIERKMEYIACLEDYGYTSKECEEIKFVSDDVQTFILHKNHKPLVIKNNKVRGFLRLV